MMSDADASPLMRQYREIKRGYPDAILLFRVGDFYEMFYEDAQVASKLLSIALTSRDKTSATPIPLCGVPYHAAQGYIAKLLKAGRTVALCEQVEDPKLAKGLVRREVVRLYTPGTLVDTEFLSPGESHFLVAVAFSDAMASSAKGQSVIGLACLDVSTGEFWMTEFQGAQAETQLMDELARLEPREVLHQDSTTHAGTCLTHLRGPRLCAQPSAAFNPKDAAQRLQTQFAVQSLDGFGCRGLTAGIGAAGAVLRYFRETQPTASLAHLRRLHTRWSSDAMHLDSATIRNLELVRPLGFGEPRSGQNQSTVLSVLDRTATAMGSRLLRDWLVRPLLDRGAIQARLDAVGELKDRIQQRVSLRTTLRDVQDIARLSSRLTLGVAQLVKVTVIHAADGSYLAREARHDRLAQLPIGGDCSLKRGDVWTTGKRDGVRLILEPVGNGNRSRPADGRVVADEPQRIALSEGNPGGQHDAAFREGSHRPFDLDRERLSSLNRRFAVVPVQVRTAHGPALLHQPSRADHLRRIDQSRVPETFHVVYKHGTTPRE